MPPPHPLRRISTGSLSSLARSTDRSTASPSGLDFLTPAITELADEVATLSSHVGKLNEMHDALGTFNEAFAAYLYALKMNAFCVEWPQAPDQNSFGRMPALAAQAAAAAAEATSLLAMQQQQQQQQAQLEAGPSSMRRVSQAAGQDPYTAGQQGGFGGMNAGDLTYATASSIDEYDVEPLPLKPAIKKPAAAPARKPINNALRKKRELEIAAIIDTLPLEYRGRDPAARTGMEKVMNKLMDNPQGLIIEGMVTEPDLPRTKVNKHLIALVAKKLVVKTNAGGKTIYKWVGP